MRNLDDPQFSFLKGKIGQIVAQSLFTAFGYNVTPFGYENHFAALVESMSRPSDDGVTQRIRSTPDIVIYDEELNRSYLVEVKFRGLKTSRYIRLRPLDLERYAKHWPHTLVLVIAPNGPDFYCQTAEYLFDVWCHENLRSKKSVVTPWGFDSTKYFKPVSDFFPRIDHLKFDAYKKGLKEKVFDVLGGNANGD